MLSYNMCRIPSASDKRPGNDVLCATGSHKQLKVTAAININQT